MDTSSSLSNINGTCIPSIDKLNEAYHRRSPKTRPTSADFEPRHRSTDASLQTCQTVVYRQAGRQLLSNAPSQTKRGQTSGAGSNASHQHINQERPQTSNVVVWWSWWSLWLFWLFQALLDDCVRPHDIGVAMSPRTDLHVAEHLGVRLPASPPPLSPRRRRTLRRRGLPKKSAESQDSTSK